ncbi:DUF7693 family protein [Pseudomonas typographi]|uniref:DUF7693 family protein n=1 Tax=Pseudomonas typographi TaxID=2715964 RepID=UPI003B8460F0
MHQAHCALAHFRGKLVRVVLAHGSHSLKSWSLRETRGGSFDSMQRFGTDPVELLSTWEHAQLESLLSSV